MRPPLSVPYPLLFPALWLGLSLGCYFTCASDQRPIWAFAAFAGTWLALVLTEGFATIDSALLWSTLVGAGCMLALGLALRRFGFPPARMARWFVLATALAGLSLTVAFGGFTKGAIWPCVLGGGAAGISAAAVAALAFAPFLGRGHSRRGR